MSDSSKIDMLAALRLTREGRLMDAVSLLRGAPAAPAGKPGKTPKFSAGKVVPGLKTMLGQAVKAPATARGTALPGRFETRHFTSDAGSRSYKLYVPGGYQGEALPLVVMLHGCTQSPDDFAAGTRMNEHAETERFLVAYPAQSMRANFTKCWNWFNPADQGRDGGEPAIIAGITREVIAEYGTRPGRVYVAGLSAGGAAAAIMGAAYPELYAAIGVHSGLACGAAHSLASATAAMQRGGRAPKPDPIVVPAIVFHGDADHTVNRLNGDHVITQAKAGRNFTATVTEGRSAGGIAYTKTAYMDFRKPMLEQWVLHGAGHAWSGGSAAGSFTEPRGPDASAEMLRFFQQHSTR